MSLDCWSWWCLFLSALNLWGITAQHKRDAVFGGIKPWRMLLFSGYERVWQHYLQIKTGFTHIVNNLRRIVTMLSDCFHTLLGDQHSPSHHIYYVQFIVTLKTLKPLMTNCKCFCYWSFTLFLKTGKEASCLFHDNYVAKGHTTLIPNSLNMLASL